MSKAGKPGKDGLFSLRGYATHRKARGLTGKSHAAVKRAIDQGRLIASVTRNEKGDIRIDAAAADAEWMANTDPAQQRDPTSARGRWSGPKDAAIDGAVNPELRLPAGGEGAGDTGRPDTIRETQAAKLVFQTKLLELDYLEKAGELCDVAGVDAEGYRIGKLVFEGMNNLIPQLAPLLAAESDQHKISMMLKTAHREAMESLIPLIERGPDAEETAEAVES